MIKKVALVKQVVYQDLYVCDIKTKDPLEILYSSIARVGPIGLITEFISDFIIVDITEDLETLEYKKVIPFLADELDKLRVMSLNKIKGQEFWEPGSELSNGHFMQNVDCINWSNYDLVVGINVPIPARVIKEHKKTLFAYMIGEANMFLDYPHFNYDVVLTQEIRGVYNSKLGIIDLPYTFLKSNTLSNIINSTDYKKGFFIEINSISERPVLDAPPIFKKLSKELGIPYYLHKQLIKDNLLQLKQAKYFIKFGGRPTRGNGALEAISIGCLVLIRKEEIIHNEILLEELDFQSYIELFEILQKLETQHDFYISCLSKQQSLLNKYCFEIPLNCLNLEFAKKQNYISYKLSRKYYIIKLNIRKKLISIFLLIKNKLELINH